MIPFHHAPLFQIFLKFERAVRDPLGGSRNRPTLFRFFMLDVLLAPLANLIQLNPIFERLFIFAGKIIHPLALGALQLDKIVLGHNDFIKIFLNFTTKSLPRTNFAIQ